LLEGRQVRIGAFEINEPVPELNEPYAFAILHPWIDVNNVGSLVLNGLETQFEARELGKLAKPGNFYDFTRYRPNLFYEGPFAGYPFPIRRFATPREKKEMTFFSFISLNPML
jgi:hypothetical protein